MKHHTHSAAHPFIEHFINNLPESFNLLPGKTIYKGRNEIKSFTGEDGFEIIVKRFPKKNFISALLATLSKSKAHKAYNNSQLFTEIGITTPTPIAYFDERKRKIIGTSYFITAPDYTPDLVNILRKPQFDAQIAKKLAQFVAHIHNRNITHGDLNLTNILYDGEKFILIDTNRAQKRKRISINQRISDLKRITHRRDLLKFIAAEYWEYMHQNHSTIIKTDRENFVISTLKTLLKMEKKKKILHYWRDKFIKKS